MSRISYAGIKADNLINVTIFEKTTQSFLQSVHWSLNLQGLTNFISSKMNFISFECVLNSLCCVFAHLYCCQFSRSIFANWTPRTNFCYSGWKQRKWAPSVKHAFIKPLCRGHAGATISRLRQKLELQCSLWLNIEATTTQNIIRFMKWTIHYDHKQSGIMSHC